MKLCVVYRLLTLPMTLSEPNYPKSLRFLQCVSFYYLVGKRTAEDGHHPILRRSTCAPYQPDRRKWRTQRSYCYTKPPKHPVHGYRQLLSARGYNAV